MRTGVVAVACFVMLAFAGPAMAKGPKVDICHWDADAQIFFVINISVNAVDKHIENHGDVYPGSWWADADGDGFGDADGATDVCPNAGFVDNDDDCDDGDAAIYPGAEEVCGDGVDNDCDGEVDEDCLPDNCVAGEFEGHTYAICQGGKNYGEAVTACGAMGAPLAHVDTQDENTYLVDLALDNFGCISYNQTSYWVSNTKSETPGGSTWPSGTPIWASGEPNGDGWHVHLIRYCGQPYGWNDVPTTYKWGWICEWAE
jgi:hypothetical protein